MDLLYIIYFIYFTFTHKSEIKYTFEIINRMINMRRLTFDIRAKVRRQMLIIHNFLL
jgi:hypothetical protein